MAHTHTAVRACIERFEGAITTAEAEVDQIKQQLTAAEARVASLVAAKTEKELEFLNRLYDLYTAVISTVDGYADILWADVTTNLDAMTEQVTQFQAQCRKLPKALREWDAYVDLRKKIDEFLEKKITEIEEV